MTDKPLNLDEFRQRLRDEDLVRCARCRKVISAVSTRCEHCGIHFNGEAHEYQNRIQVKRGFGRVPFTRWKLIVIAIMIIAMGIGSLWL